MKFYGEGVTVKVKLARGLMATARLADPAFANTSATTHWEGGSAGQKSAQACVLVR
jgi:hypothetical protein